MEKAPPTNNTRRDDEPQGAPQVAKKVSDEYLCAICLCLLCDPVRTRCKHDFCEFCITQMRDCNDTFRCPLCRQRQSYNSVRPNKDLEQVLTGAFGTEYAARGVQVARMRKAYERHLKLHFQIGNKCTSVPNQRSENRHQWTVFVRLHDGDISKYVKSVRFTLHPTFSPPVVTITKAPFQLTRIGWGTFNIEIDVIWKAEFNKSDTHFSHFLDFDNEEVGRIQVVRLEASQDEDNSAPDNAMEEEEQQEGTA